MEGFNGGAGFFEEPKRNYGINGINGKERIFSVYSVYSVCSVVSLSGFRT
jgi:hypothetical protein